MTNLATINKVSDGGAANWLRDFVSRGGQKKSDGECLLKAASKMDELSFEIERMRKGTCDPDPRILHGQVIDVGRDIASNDNEANARQVVVLAVTKMQARAFAKLLYLDIVMSVTTKDSQ